MWQYNHIGSNDLLHYGKLGMKWGRHTTKTTTSGGGTKKVTTSAFTPWTGKTRTVIKEPGKKKSIHTETKSDFLGTKKNSDYKMNSDGSTSFVETSKSKDSYKKNVNIKNADGSRKTINTVNDMFKNTTTVSTMSKEQINAGRAYAISESLLKTAIRSL